MSEPKYQVLPRPGVSGWGLFATEEIRQGEKICGLPIQTQENADRYSIEAQDGLHVDCSASPVGMMNHSCAPNAAVFNWKIVAWTCIKPGDEITINYKRTESKLAEPFLCACGHCKEGTRIE